MTRPARPGLKRRHIEGGALLYIAQQIAVELREGATSVWWSIRHAVWWLREYPKVRRYLLDPPPPAPAPPRVVGPRR